MSQPPYILAVASHKGGTGRTTAALSLAWCWGSAGRQVTLVDADPIRAAGLLALDETGKCRWPNVTYQAGLEALDGPLNGDVVLIDSPSLLDKISRVVLHKARGVILTCLADPLSLRTVPAAAAAIDAARGDNPRLGMLGILVGIYNARDSVQATMLDRLRQGHRELLLQPVVPIQPEVRQWPMSPGSQPPQGPALDSFAEIARRLDPVAQQGRPA